MHMRKAIPCATSCLNKQKRETEASVSLFCRNLKFDLVLRLFHGAGTDAAQTGERGDDDGRGRADGEKGNADAESERKCEQNEDCLLYTSDAADE